MEIQSANQQHPVPQNVMEVEFKLIGDLTIRQFTYLLVFGGLIFLTLNLPLPVIFKYPLAIVEFFMGIGFAFLPVNDVPMDKWVANYIAAITKPRIRVWKHTSNLPYFLDLNTTQVKQDQANSSGTQPTQRKSIEELLENKKEAPDFKDESDLDEREKEFMQNLGMTYKQKEEKQTGITSEFQETTQQQDELEDKGGFTSIALQNRNQKANSIKLQEKIKEEQNNKPDFSSAKLTAPAKPLPTNQQTASQGTDTTQKEHEQYLKNIEELNKLKDKLLDEIERNKIKIVKGREEEIEKIAKEEIEKREKEFSKLKHQNVELAEKLKKLQESKEKPNQQNKVEPKVEENSIPDIEEVPEEGKTTSLFTGFMEKLAETRKASQLPKIEPKKDELFDKIREVPKTNDQGEIIDTRATTIAGIVKGSTKDTQGDIIPACIIIIKNEDSDPVIALKSNSLGEFETTTPLNKGIYTVEAIKDEYEFSPVKIEALGSVINPVKLIGKRV